MTPNDFGLRVMILASLALFAGGCGILGGRSGNGPTVPFFSQSYPLWRLEAIASDSAFAVSGGTRTYPVPMARGLFYVVIVQPDPSELAVRMAVEPQDAIVDARDPLTEEIRAHMAAVEKRLPKGSAWALIKPRASGICRLGVTPVNADGSYLLGVYRLSRDGTGARRESKP